MIVGAKVRGILRDNIEDKMVIVLARPGGILMLAATSDSVYLFRHHTD